jgi:hypothetical protein
MKVIGAKHDDISIGISHGKAGFGAAAHVSVEEVDLAWVPRLLVGDQWNFIRPVANSKEGQF